MNSFLSILRRYKRDVNNPIEKEGYSYLGDICVMLSWKYPYYSLINFLILNYFLWLAAYSNFQLISLISTIFLLKFVYQNTLGLENTRQSSSKSEEIHKIIKAFINSMSLFRIENPSEFCMAVSVSFFTVAYIATSVSGVRLSCITLWCLFVTPLLYASMPPLVRDKLEAWGTRIFQVAIAEEDLLPLPVENKLDDNEDLESLDTDRTADSVTNSLISGISSMPSFLDAEDNHEILEEDLIPINSPPNHAHPTIFGDLSSDSDSDLKDIHFKESHLSRESSSEEEGAFEEGLLFEESQDQSNVEQKGFVHNIVDYVKSTGGFQLPNFLTMTKIQSTETKNISKENSSSEEDFEIIDVKELK